MAGFEPASEDNLLSQDMASDPELKKTQQATVNIFLEFYSKTIPAPAPSCNVEPAQPTSRPSCTPSTSTTKSKSRETHPKAVHSTTCHVRRRSTDANSTHSTQQPTETGPLATSTPTKPSHDREDFVIISQADVHALRKDSTSASPGSTRKNRDTNRTASPTDGGTRPESLLLDVKHPAYKRGVSNTSSSSGKTTPCPDPPLFSPTADLVQSYPPTAATGQWMPHNGGERSVVEVLPRHHVGQLNVSDAWGPISRH